MNPSTAGYNTLMVADNGVLIQINTMRGAHHNASCGGTLRWRALRRLVTNRPAKIGPCDSARKGRLTDRGTLGQ
jgi:hypothetical protein